MTLSNIDEIKQLKVLGKSSLFSGQMNTKIWI